MGNCVFGGVVGGKEVIKVIRSNGGIMEFNVATTAESITDEFPGHAIFPSNHLFWKPVPHHQLLLPGNSYYLLPIIPDLINNATTTSTSTSDQLQRRRLGHIRSNTTTSCTSAAAVAPYRMSFHQYRTRKFLKTKTTYSSRTQHDDQQAGGRPRGGVSTATNNNNNNNNNNYSIRNCGVWKVKLVISPQQLVHILSQQVPTQDLIDSVRTVAKCGIHYGSDIADDSSFAFSHHHQYWTLSTTSS